MAGEFLQGLLSGRDAFNQRLNQAMQQRQYQQAMAQQQFENAIRQQQMDYARQQDARSNFVSLFGDVNKMPTAQAVAYAPMLAGMAKGTGIQFDPSMPLGMAPQPKVTGGQLLQALYALGEYDPATQQMFAPIVMSMARDAGYNIPGITGPVTPQMSPEKAAEIGLKAYGAANTLGMENVNNSVLPFVGQYLPGGVGALPPQPQAPQPTQGLGVNLGMRSNAPLPQFGPMPQMRQPQPTGMQMPGLVAPTVSERKVEIDREKAEAQRLDMFRKMVADNSLGTMPPEQRFAFLKELMPNISDAKLQGWANMTQSLTPGQQAMIDKITLQEKNLELALKRFEHSKQMAEANLAVKIRNTNSMIQKRQAELANANAKLVNGKPVNATSLLTQARLTRSEANNIIAWLATDHAQTLSAKDRNAMRGRADRMLKMADDLDAAGADALSASMGANRQAININLDGIGQLGTGSGKTTAKPASARLSAEHAKILREAIIDDARQGKEGDYTGPNVRAMLTAWGYGKDAQKIWVEYAKKYFWPNHPSKKKR